MAYFKLCLLTPRIENQQIGFIEDIMTEFDILTGKEDDLQTRNTEDLYENRDRILTVSDSYAKHDTVYTYNEKVTFSQNGQKTLSFDLNRYIMKENEWVENPYSHLLTEGTQILLTDQYTNEYFFTVVSTKFNIRENNIVYNISCQDSFSYQTTRQNDGYTITNDPNEDDFIGAKTIDWGVLKKIVPECYLTNYTYLSCNTGLYEAEDGSYHTFKYNEDIYNVRRVIKEAHTPPIYNTANDTIVKENDIDYFEKVSFSCSGVNVDAALIQLGEQINLQLDTFEHAQIKNGQRTKYFDRYFGFEPQKNDKRIGLTYSPSYNIKNFDLTHQGQSLTTVLNVNGPTYDDEIITLIPDVPEFFLTYFNSSNGENSSYTPGVFTQLCKNRILSNVTENEAGVVSTNSAYFIADTSSLEFFVNNTGTDAAPGETTTKVRFPIYNHRDETNTPLFSMPPFYTNFKFSYKEEQESSNKKLFISNILGIIREGTSELAQLLTANNCTGTLMYVTKRWYISADNGSNGIATTKTLKDIPCDASDNEVTIGADGFYYINNKQTNITITTLEPTGVLRAELRDDDAIEVNENVSNLATNLLDVQAYIVINTEISDTSSFSLDKPQLYLNFYRDFTADEINFAQIADMCPGLENKLIDFTYFKNSNIISQKEYDVLMDIILNQLRRVNGSLMFYARGYYRALQERTKMLAELINNLDSLGAACQAAVIDPIASTGRTSDDNRQYFENAYSLLMNSPWQKKALLKYDDTVTDYFSKYFNAQQRFLKNIYNFRSYFNAPYISSVSSLYGYKLNIINSSFYHDGDVFYSFDNTTWKSITSDFKDYAGAGYEDEPDDETVSNYGQPYYTIYKYNAENGQYVIAPIADKSMADNGELYKYPSLGDEGFYCDATDTYKDIQYGQVVFDIPAFRDENDPTVYRLLTTDGPAISKNGTTKNYTGKQRFKGDISDAAIIDYPGDGAYYVGLNNGNHPIRILCGAGNFKLTNAGTGEGYVRFYQIRQGKIFAEDEHDLIPAEPVDSIQMNVYCFGSSNNFDPKSAEAELNIVALHPITARFANDSFTKNDEYQIGYQFAPSPFVKCTAKVVNATQENIIENGILNQADKANGFENIVKRTYPLYQNMWSDAGKEIYNENGIMYEGQSLMDIANVCYQTILATKDCDPKFLQRALITTANGKVKDEEQRKLYYHNLPITDLYQNSPYFQIDEKVDDNNNVAYYFKRLNKNGQSLADYIKYLQNDQPVYTVTNPYDRDQQTKIRVPYVTPQSEQDFYRKTVRNLTFSYATALPIMMALGLTDLEWSVRNSGWPFSLVISIYSGTTDGIGCQDVKGNDISHNGRGYCDIIDNLYKDSTLYAQHPYPLYAVSSDTMKQRETYIHAIETAKSQQLSSGVSSLTISINNGREEYLKLPIESVQTTENTLTFEYSTPEESQIIKHYDLINYGYTFRDAPESAQFIDTSYESLTLEDTVYKNQKYAMIVIHRSDDELFKQEEGGKETLNRVLEKSLSSTFYYPIINQSIALDMSAYKGTDEEAQNGINLKDFLEKGGRATESELDSPHIIQYFDGPSGNNNAYSYIIFFRVRDYDIEEMSILYNDAVSNYASKNKGYDKRTYNAFSFLSQVGVTEGFIRIPTVENDLITTKAGDFDINDGIYFDANKQRIYTIKQLDSKYRYIQTTQKDYEYAQLDQNKFPVTIIRNEKIGNDEHTALRKIEKETLNTLFELDFTDITETTAGTIEGYDYWKEKTFIVGDDIIVVQRGRTIGPTINLKGLTNGSFWYYYHNSLNHPLLFEQAAAIETQLTEYWTNAYYASKGCEYFLPEYWTETAQQNTNYFNRNIYSIIDNVAVLSNYYLPEVLIYKPKNNSAQAPMYRLYFKTLDATEEDFNKNDITDGSQLVHASSIVQNNPAYYYAFERLMPEDPSERSHGVAEKIGQTTYYYVENLNSGMLGEDFVGSALQRQNAYQEMSGNYVMGYRLLRKNYYNSDFAQYTALQKEHDQIWKTLYENYGFLILENSYNNDTATTSQDLLITSQLYFKDRKIPERAYNISVIDTSSLDNYEGAEIRIGDGIRINAKEYYDEYDLVYQSLSQYLFITDISYTLRNTADINLTVNSIKYEEGIIKRLAKLIK